MPVAGSNLLEDKVFRSSEPLSRIRILRNFFKIKPVISWNGQNSFQQNIPANWDLAWIWICNEKFEFLDLVDFGVVAFSVESVITRERVILSIYQGYEKFCHCILILKFVTPNLPLYQRETETLHSIKGMRNLSLYLLFQIWSLQILSLYQGNEKFCQKDCTEVGKWSFSFQHPNWRYWLNLERHIWERHSCFCAISHSLGRVKFLPNKHVRYSD